ncbi:MAG TPA: hypothetical protein VGM81_15450 [Burkholderiaceae bacterium]|jgi:mono/diheme cytochrome c family protein
MSSLRLSFIILSAVCCLALGDAAPARIAASDPTGEAAEASAEFLPIATVLKSPRCQNCHTDGDFPRQGDDRHRHWLNVVRGPSDHGAPGLSCVACHAAKNNNESGVPGAPNWRVAPIGQQWETLDAAALCRKLRDPATNGARSLSQLEEHLNADALVQWAWSPGTDAHGHTRSLPPIDQKTFHALVSGWIAKGAPCPR